MKNCFLSLVSLILLLIGCGKAIDINKEVNNGRNSFIITYFPNNVHALARNNYISNMPEPNTFFINLGQTVKQPTSTPKLIGYSFKGWYTDVKTSKQYDFNTPVTKDLNLYAKWDINSYTITFIANKPDTAINSIEVTRMPQPSTQSVNHGVALNQPTLTPELLNYKFLGWFTEKETLHQYIFSSLLTKDIQLYAKWIKKIYRVSFYPNKPIIAGNSVFATGMPEPSTKKVLRNNIQTEPATSPELEGYSFLGWFTEAETTNQFVFSTPIVKDTQLFAKWGKHDVTITYIHNIPETARKSLKVTNMPEPSSFKIPFGTKIPIPTSIPIHYNFRFKGWFTQKENGAPYDFNTPVKNDIAIYAQWFFLPRYKNELLLEIRRKRRTDGESPNLNYIDTSLITDMSLLFNHLSYFNGNISNWNVSKVKNMNNMFSHAYSFNQDIGKWNVSAVQNMRNMFLYAYSFNQDISDWNVSAVQNMNDMFRRALEFNQDISDWNVSAVQNMPDMFAFAISFNQDLNNWNVSAVQNMSDMFFGAYRFNQDLNNWNVSAVQNMRNMFKNAGTFNGNISNWNVSVVRIMSGMFYNAQEFNGNISDWNVAAVNDMSDMFSYTKIFNQDLNNWNVAAVNDMSDMFSYTKIFNQDLNNWNVSAVQNMRNMFYNAFKFNGNISNWNVTAVRNMKAMFTNAKVFNANISNWNVSTVRYMQYIFKGASAFNQNLDNWNVGTNVSKKEAFVDSGLAKSPPAWTN